VPTFCIACAIIWPIFLFAVRRDGADLGDFRHDSTFLGALLDVLDDSGDRYVDAAL